MTVSRSRPEPSVRLHPQYGLNPYMPLCFFCGQSRGDIVLLGTQALKILGHEEASKAPSVALDYTPCPSCEHHMEHGIILVGVDPDSNRENPLRTGEFLVVTEAFIRAAIQPEALVESILKTRFAFVPQPFAREIMARYEALSKKE